MIVTDRCRFVDCNKRTTLVQDVDSGEVCHVWIQGVDGNSMLSVPFCYETRTSL